MAHKVRILEDGREQCYDTETGDIIWTQRLTAKREKRIKDGKNSVRRNINRTAKRKSEEESDRGKILMRMADGTNKLMPKGTDPSQLNHTVYPYNKVTKDIVLQYIMEGMTLQDVSKQKGMPPAHTIYYWMRHYPDFKSEFQKAKEMRAEYFHDKAIEVAEKSKKTTINQDKLKVSTYKWAAQVNNPKDYSGKSDQVAATNPTQINIFTGVPQKDDEPETTVIEVDGKPLDN